MGTIQRSPGIFFLVTALVAGLAGAACGSTRGSATASSENGAFEVKTSQLFITVANRSGRPLVDIRVGIVPAGRMTTFTTSYARMESAEKRDFSLALFRSSDGTPFSLRVHRPRSVKVSGKDLDGKTHETEVSWD